MKTIFIIICICLMFPGISRALELESDNVPLDKKSALIVMSDAVGEPFECGQLFKENRQALGLLLSHASLSKANVYTVFLGLFSETAEVKYRIEAGREPDAVRFKRFSEKINEAMKTIDSRHAPQFNTIGNRKAARDVAGALMYAGNFIAQHNLLKQYDKAYIVFLSPMLQTLSREQTMKYLQTNHIKFPDGVSLLVLGKAHLCQDVTEIERQIFNQKLIAFWQSVIEVKDFRFFDSY